MERGKAKVYYTSSASNASVKAGAGTLYHLNTQLNNGGSIQIVDAANMGTAPDLNLDLSGVIYRLGPVEAATKADFNFGPGIGINTALGVSITSNSRTTIVYE